MRTASPYLALALVAGVAAMAWVLIQPALRAEGGSSDPHVSEKPGITVSNEGEEKAEKIDPGVLEEEKVADYVEVGPTVTLIQSLPYLPPTIDWFFKPFPQANPWEHVDIHNKPPDAIQKRVVPPTSLNDTDNRVRIEGMFENASVPDWPLRCEGNLTPPSGGGQGTAAFYWAAKIRAYVVDLDTDTNNNGTIDDYEDEYEEYPSGRVVCLDREGDGEGLDDLGLIVLTPPDTDEGTVKLEAIEGGSLIKVWRNADKSGEVVLPATWSPAETPGQLYVDGIALGQVVLKLSHTPPAGDGMEDSVALYVTDTISWCPDSNLYDEQAFAVSWEPNAYPPGAPGWLGQETADAVLNGVKDQGYNITIFRYQDTSPVTPNDPDPDADIGSCTRANFNTACCGAVLHVMAHGAVGCFDGVYRNSQERIDAWIAGEPITKMEAVNSSVGWRARVYSQWLKDNWKPVLDQNKAIVVFLPCRNVESWPLIGAESTLDACGGRVRFGNEGAISTNITGADLEKLFGRMNGTQEGGTKRTAGKAYGDGIPNDYQAIVMHGNGDNTHKWTTLCPAPNAVFPTAAPGNRKGAGCIIFDTYMNDDISADEAVTKAAGAVPVSARRWFGNPAAVPYLVSFDFDKTGGGTATMRANADKCRSRENHSEGGRYMDGNRVAPNGDKKEWSF